MHVDFHMTPRMAEVAGFRQWRIELPVGARLGEALLRLAEALRRGTGARLCHGGRLHPSVLVVVDGRACLPGDDPALVPGEIVQLLLPVAGG